MRQEVVVPKEVIIELLVGAVPERKQEVKELWDRYSPQLLFVSDACRVTLDANKNRIRFDAKTIDVFWLIGFAGWKAIECYGPLVLLSACAEEPLSRAFSIDAELGEFERDYKERRAAAQSLIDAAEIELAPWPTDIPRPTENRDGLDDVQFKSTFDLTQTAVAFTFFHEFRHVMLDTDDERPLDLREEEMACDVWAREFMTAKIGAYAAEHGIDYNSVLCRRAMGLLLAALIIHEITPNLDHGGNRSYFSTRDRMQAIIDNTNLPEEDSFWLFAASLLVGIYRQRGEAIKTGPMSPKSLALQLLGGL